MAEATVSAVDGAILRHFHVSTLMACEGCSFPAFFPRAFVLIVLFLTPNLGAFHERIASGSELMKAKKTQIQTWMLIVALATEESREAMQHEQDYFVISWKPGFQSES